MRFLILFFIAFPSYGVEKPKVLDVASDKEIAFEEVSSKCYATVFYASWCVGCSAMMEATLDLKAKRKQEKPVCVVSIDTDKKAAQSYFKGKSNQLNALTSNMYLDKEGAYASAMSFEGVPMSLIFDSSGKIAEKHFGKMSESH